VILAPSSGLIRSSDSLTADRYSYLALVGGVVVAAAGLGRLQWPSGPARPGVVGIMAMSLGTSLGLAVSTWNQCRIWHDSVTLWTHVLNHGAGSSSVAHIGLGTAFSLEGKLAEAAAQYTEALRLTPNHPDAHKNLGVVLSLEGKLAEAIAHHAEALRLNPGDADAHKNLGILLSHQGKLAEAAAHHTEALRLDPDDADAYKNLGIVLSLEGKFAAAVAQYTAALQLNPDDVEAHNNLAMLLAACPEATYRDGKRAIQLAIRACQLTGWKSPNCLDTLAAAYAEAGDFDAAVQWQRRAIEALKDEGKKEGYRSRLVLYQAKKHSREASPVAEWRESAPEVGPGAAAGQSSISHDR
jgi:tetratricopeptide (TPR) repeat protein